MILTFDEIRRGVDKCGKATTTTGDDEYNGGGAAQEAAVGIS